MDGCEVFLYPPVCARVSPGVLPVIRVRNDVRALRSDSRGGAGYQPGRRSRRTRRTFCRGHNRRAAIESCRGRGSASCRERGRKDAGLATTAAINTGPARATKVHSRQSTSAAKAGTTVHRRQPTAAAAKAGTTVHRRKPTAATAKAAAGPGIPINIKCNGQRQGRRHRRHRQRHRPEELVADPTRTASRVTAADCTSSKPRS